MAEPKLLLRYELDPLCDYTGRIRTNRNTSYLFRKKPYSGEDGRFFTHAAAFRAKQPMLLPNNEYTPGAQNRAFLLGKGTLISRRPTPPMQRFAVQLRGDPIKYSKESKVLSWDEMVARRAKKSKEEQARLIAKQNAAELASRQKMRERQAEKEMEKKKNQLAKTQPTSNRSYVAGKSSARKNNNAARKTRLEPLQQQQQQPQQQEQKRQQDAREQQPQQEQVEVVEGDGGETKTMVIVVQ